MLGGVVQGYAVAIIEDARSAGHLERLEAELAVFFGAVEGSEALRTALSDPNISIVERLGIIDDLLVGRSETETAELVRFCVRAMRPAEIATAVGELRLLVRRALTGDGRGETAVGRQSARDRLRGYADRVLSQLATKADLFEAEDEIFRFARMLETNPALRRALEDRNVSSEIRVDLLQGLLSARVRPFTLRLCSYVLEAGHVRNLIGTYDLLVELVAAERGRRLAEVRSAVELSEAQRERLASALCRIVGREVEVRVVLDDAVIGGMFVSAGDVVIDATVRLRVERLRDDLVRQI